MPDPHAVAATAVGSAAGGRREGAEGAAAAGTILSRRHRRRIHPRPLPTTPPTPDLPREGGDDERGESIHDSLSLPVSDHSLHLKLLASEYRRRILQDHVFALEEDLRGDGIVDLSGNVEGKRRPATMLWIGRRRCGGSAGDVEKRNKRESEKVRRERGGERREERGKKRERKSR
uniref:Uncharacterized protein n=1 Tax=Oryza glumipatula TaxID=40148 RepID=A0A0E0AUG2_9ORYZ